jgi:hypothetical protein
VFRYIVVIPAKAGIQKSNDREQTGGTRNMFKVVAFLLLLIGFAVFLILCIDVSGYTYRSWIMHMRNLPSGDTVTREAVSSEIREMSLQYNQYFRFMIWPALSMLTGGVMLGIRRAPKKPGTAKL